MVEPRRKRGTNAIDRHVGARIRAQRKALGMSQEALANALDITFQQIQKYEAGRNRVSAAMLFALASRLAVPVASFYEGLPTAGAAPPSAALWRQFEHLIATEEGKTLMRLFTRIATSRYRRAVVELVQAHLDDNPARYSAKGATLEQN